MATFDQTMMKVQRILTGPMNLKVMLAQDSFKISFSQASTHVFIRVVEWEKDAEGEPRTLIVITCPILLEVPATPQVYEWVARNGGSRWFGHVEVFDEDEMPGHLRLYFSHTLLGDFIDQPELETAMWAVLSTADSWDDELQPRFGGKRVSDF